MTVKPLLVYLAHPLGREDRAINLKRARLWMLWAWEKHPNVYPVMNWALLAEMLDETPENRERGLQGDAVLAAQCDEVWLVGGRVSEGMRRESAGHRKVVDLTHL